MGTRPQVSEIQHMPSITTYKKITAALAPMAAAAALVFAPAASADVTCTQYAAPSGSDSAEGTLDAPYRTAQQLANSLNPGDVGCLRAGTYLEDVTVSKPGTADARVTLTSYPGERAKVIGRFWVSRTGDYSTISNLDLNGTPKRGTNDADDPSPTLNADNITFTGNDVTNDNSAICFLLGNAWGAVHNTLIQGNRIHNCGDLPAENHAHGIYVEESTDARILNNLIYDNADRGVQLYPNAEGTLVRGNVIDGNGEGIIFSGDGGQTSNNNTVDDNIISNSNQRNNVESWYPDGNPIGRGNVVRNNCIGGGVRDQGRGGISSQWGFTVENNNVIGKNPRFVNRAGKDFRLQADSPCKGIANGATGSSAARPNGAGSTTTPPANPTPNPPSNPTPVTPAPSKSGPAVTLTTRRARGGRVRLSGRIRRGTVRSAGAAPKKAVIQMRWDGAWFTLKSARLRGGRFSSQLRIPAVMRGRLLVLRVVIPTVGKSSTVKVRAR
jgi:parallel beta-helix repeat protein